MHKVDHPNIVQHLETYNNEEARQVFIVMGLIDGEKLFKRIERQHLFKEKVAAKYMHQMLKAVNHCHALGIAHRDL